MRAAVPLILTLTLGSGVSAAAAGPLLGTASSFFESTFCKKYACVLVARATDANSPGTTNYTYRLSGGSKVTVHRNASNVIFLAALKYEGAVFTAAASGKGDALAAAFAKALTGRTMLGVSNYASNCIRHVRAEAGGITFCPDLDSGVYRLFGAGMLRGQGLTPGTPEQDTLVLQIMKPF